MKTNKNEVIDNLMCRFPALTRWEAEVLRRCAMTLSRWDEELCNGTIQTDDDGRNPVRVIQSMRGPDVQYKIADRERGALKRAAAVVAALNLRHATAGKGGLVHLYHQGDPRGASLYLVANDDLRGEAIDCAYYRGVAIYK